MATVFRVARLRSDQWRLEADRFERPEMALRFARSAKPPGYVVELDHDEWPVSIRWCDPDRAREIVEDLRAAGDVKG